jgi:uncharacterized protein (UPF0276 family)
MKPPLGFGLGLRPVYYQEILDQPPRVDWFEIISENFMVPGGRPLAMLEKIRARYPVVMHGVSLSLGSTDPLDRDYLRDLKALADRIEPALISDHLAWTGVGGVNLHDLLPIPYTQEALTHVVERIARVQDVLGRRLLVENPSTYVRFADADMDEASFIAELARRADCLLLLDVNNVFVSAFNHGFSAQNYLEKIPAERVAQIHLAGHSDCSSHKIDTHDQPVCEEVWRLYAEAISRFGKAPTMIERDDNFPDFEDLLAELDRARAIAAQDGLRRVA